MPDPYAQPTNSCLPVLLRWLIAIILVGLIIRAFVWAF